jgi:hypothetical protein
MTDQLVERTCESCAVTFLVAKSRGRYPRRCETCDPDRHAVARRERQIRRLRGTLDDVWRHDRAPLVADVLRAAAVLAVRRVDVDRQALQRATSVALNARGPAELRVALVALAAVSLAWASHLSAHVDEEIAA